MINDSKNFAETIFESAQHISNPSSWAERLTCDLLPHRKQPRSSFRSPHPPHSGTQKCGGEKISFWHPHLSWESGKRWNTEEKHAWLLYQYKVNVMKLALMVHQFGTPGEERGGRLLVMNVLFGRYCTQQQIPAFHTDLPFWPAPAGCSSCCGHVVSAEHQKRRAVRATPCRWSLLSVSAWWWMLRGTRVGLVSFVR